MPARMIRLGGRFGLIRFIDFTPVQSLPAGREPGFSFIWTKYKIQIFLVYMIFFLFFFAFQFFFINQITN
jgi:hypothetical protein